YPIFTYKPLKTLKFSKIETWKIVKERNKHFLSELCRATTVACLNPHTDPRRRVLEDEAKTISFVSFRHRTKVERRSTFVFDTSDKWSLDSSSRTNSKWLLVKIPLR
ncbi:hypothetical protein PanWU01x14_146320, partial [Parasponia andersonii]